MNRKHFCFACEGLKMAASLDMASGTTGLLIISGGNELRAGPWSSQAKMADKIAASGFPVLRFDRRGVGDSEGANGTFAASGPDIAAAITAFRSHVPTLNKIVAFGNCDAASALMLTGGAGCDALVLANPWTFDPEPALESQTVIEESVATPMPPAAMRSYYLRRLMNPAALKRLFSGRVKVGKMANSLVDAVRPAPPPSILAEEMARGLQAFPGPATILLAANDRTAQAFKAVWNKGDTRVRTCPDAGHSFVEPQARVWLQGQLLGALRSV